MIPLLKLTPYTGATVAPSPNHGARRAPAIEGIVLHATDDAGDERRALAWMRSPRSQVSCHMLVGRSGEVTRLVGDHQRAWHAGLSWWRGTEDVNSITLGIEIANRNDGEPYTDEQYHRVADIVAHYCRQGLTLDDVVSHASIAAGRRTDPFNWDWDRLRALVQMQLRGPGSWQIAYDRRSGERVAGEAGASGAAAIIHPRPPVPAAPTTARSRVTAIPKGKSALCSRTVWLNGLTVLATGSLIIGETLDLAFSIGLTIPEEITVWALFGIGVVNIVLRYQTACPIGASPGVSRPR